MVDGGPDSNWVLEGVVVVVLSYCPKVVFILLIHEGDGYGFSGSEGRGILVCSVAGAEGQVANNNDL